MYQNLFALFLLLSSSAALPAKLGPRISPNFGLEYIPPSRDSGSGFNSEHEYSENVIVPEVRRTLFPPNKGQILAVEEKDFDVSERVSSPEGSETNLPDRSSLFFVPNKPSESEDRPETSEIFTPNEISHQNIETIDNFSDHTSVSFSGTTEDLTKKVAEPERLYLPVPKVIEAEDSHFDEEPPQSESISNLIIVPAQEQSTRMVGMPYEFNWGVEDRANGNEFSQDAFSDGHITRGGYQVLMPDNRYQIVRYYDDGNGYNVDISYKDKL